MRNPAERFGFDILVELMAAHQSQSLDGSPVSRVENRLSVSLTLARQAGLTDLRLFLERRDFGWLCISRGIDRVSTAAGQMHLDGFPVRQALSGMDSHIVGRFADGREASDTPFPIVQDPSLIPGFVQRIPSETDKAEMLRRVQVAAIEAVAGKTTVH